MQADLYQPTIAIVGRPNVGKSAIFNRLAGRKISIVHDQPGVTRDRISAPCKMTDTRAILVDTGGIGATLEDGFADQVTTEAEIAMETADLILFVVDARDGITPIDQALSKKLRNARPTVQLVVNKVDSANQEHIAADFASLGFGMGLTTSAEHGTGFSQLCDRIDEHLSGFLDTQQELADDDEDDDDSKSLKIALVGRPNVGKSSLVNAILKDERTIVSDIAGTTRDAVDIPYLRGDDHFTLIDTAGLRQRQKMDTSVEVFSAMRTERSIRRADLCLLVIDSEQGVTAMDRKIAKVIQQERKPCIIILNKWDLFEPKRSKEARMKKLSDHVRSDLFFLNYAPFVVCSAKEGQFLNKIFATIQRVREASSKTITTGILNRLLAEAMDANPPSQHKKLKKRFKLFYASPAVNERYTKIPVPSYILFVNDKRLLQESYEQYLANRIKEKHPQLGLPIVFSVRSRNASKSQGKS